MVDRGRQQLTRNLIVATALELVDADGLAKLSLRRLGAALGVEGMAIYHHIANKDALIAALISRVTYSIAVVPPAELSWDERLRIMYGDLRTNVLSHPNLAEVVLTRPVQNIESARVTEAQLRAYYDAGLRGALVLSAHRTIGSYVVGYIAVEVRALTGRTEEPLWGPEVSSEEFPFLTASTEYVEQLTWDEQFDAGLEMYFEAIRSRLHQQ